MFSGFSYQATPQSSALYLLTCDCIPHCHLPFAVVLEPGAVPVFALALALLAQTCLRVVLDHCYLEVELGTLWSQSFEKI